MGERKTQLPGEGSGVDAVMLQALHPLGTSLCWRGFHRLSAELSSLALSAPVPAQSQRTTGSKALIKELTMLQSISAAASA